MARRPAATNDFKAHTATFSAFISTLKWAAGAILLIVIALYCYIVGGQPVLGTLVLLLIPAGAVFKAATSLRT